MMWGLVIQLVTLAVLAVLAVMFAVVFRLARTERKEAIRYAVTLIGNEGAFVGLCVEKRKGYWTFVDVRIMPANPGAEVVQAAPGELHVPYRNILYYQEIANVAE